MFSGLALRTRRAHCFARFCMVFDMVFDMVFARFLHVEQLVFSHVEQLVFLHDMWNCTFFCMTRTACTVLHGFCMWNSLFFFTRGTACTFFCMTRGTACTVLHGFACHVHVVQPQSAPCFFLVRLPYVGSSWRTSQGGAVPSGHLGKCAEQARCRAGTYN